MSTPIEQLALRLKQRFSDAAVDLDPPKAKGGTWFLDFDDGDYSVDVEWRPDRAFGVSAGPGSYGAGPDEAIPDVETAFTRVVQLVLGRGRTQPPAEARLAELRRARGMTQSELAARLDVKQAAVSRLENRDDVRLSSLRSAVVTLGRELRLQVKSPGGASVRLTPPGTPLPDGDR